MKWIELTTENGNRAWFNVDNIAYVAEPPDDAAKRGVGAGLALVDNGMEVIPVEEPVRYIMEQLAPFVDDTP